MEKRTVITITEAYGSGGGEIGRELAARLSLPFYDGERLLEISRGILSFDEEEACYSRGERSALLYRLSTGVEDCLNSAPAMRLSDGELMLYRQIEAAKAVSGAGACVLFLPCARYLLRGISSRVDLFVCASLRDRIRRVAEQEKITEAAAKKRLRTEGARQKKMVALCTGKRRELPYTYFLSLNSSLLGISGTLLTAEAALKTTKDGQFSQ